MQNSKHSLPRQILAILATWTLLIPILPMPTAVAFLKNNEDANNFSAGGSATHESITSETITAYDKKLFALGNKPLKENMKKALEEIIQANMDVDSGFEVFRSASHFDAENFQGAQKRLMDHKLKIKDLMLEKKPNIKDARKYLGQALHTLQDFYSHSNWVELNRGAYYDVLGVPGKPLTNPPANTPTCKDCERNACENCPGYLTATDLTTGYYALRITENIFGNTVLEKSQEREKPNDLKCSHGGRIRLALVTLRDSTGKGTRHAGINKDTKNCNISPHKDNHVTAGIDAKVATEKYLDDIKRLIKVKKMKLLLGGGPTLAMTIDTTGSMEGVILQVKQQAIQIVSSRIGTDEEPSNYVLVPFNDPSVGPVITTEDPFEFMQAISSLTADGGGDCPELSMTGMLQALNSMEDEGGELLMFTDASSKDASLVGAVEGIALSRSISISPMAFGSCSPIDPGYIRLANNTGGQLFVLSGAEAGSITKLADFLNRSNAVDVLHASGTLSGTAKTYDVPVDSTITRVTFSVSGTSTVTVTRPNNTVVQPTDPNVTNVPLSSGAVYSLTNMPTGMWHVTVNGTGDFSVRVVAESPLDFSFFNFLENTDPSVHGEFSGIPGFPGANSSRVWAQVSGEANTAQFAFRNPDGSALQTLNLTELGWANEDPAEQSFTIGPVRQFAGEVTPPATAFRTYITGVDANGIAYQRVKSAITKTQTVKIEPPDPVDLTPGQSTTYVFKVTNSGATDTFSLTGSDDKGFLTSVSPATVTLTNGQTADVSVVLQPPASTDKALDTLTLSAQSTGSSGAFNFARVKSVVLPTATATLVFEEVVVTERSGNKNGVIEAGEGGSISARIVNTGASSASGISVTVTSTTPGVLIETGSSTYPSIGPDLIATNTTPLTFSVNSSVVCGQEINLVLTATKSGSPPLVQEVSVPIGVATGQVNTTQTINYTGPAVAIPDANPSGVNIPIAVSGFTGSVADLDFKINGSSCTTTAGATTVGLDHTFVGDLVVTLTSPQGKTVTLIDRIGIGNNSGNNFCNTRLDDEATGGSVQALLTANAPHTGTFTPATPLSSFDGENPNGTWVLNVSDRAGSDVGSVRAFSLIMSDSSCSVPPADNTAPTCELTASNAGPPPSIDVSVRDTGVGLAAINIVAANNVDVAVSPFAPGETEPVVVTGTLINPNSSGSFEIQSVDMVGNVASCPRTINGSSTLTPIFSDDFNDNNLSHEPPWRTDSLLTSFSTDMNVFVTETAQHLEIGPLQTNAADSYAGVVSALLYSFNNGYCHAELVQAPSAQTNADASFSIGNSLGYYQIRVSHGSFIGVKNILNNETTLFTIPYNAATHRFLRIRYDSATGNVVFETAPGNGGVPGTWVQRYSEPWNSTLGFNSFQFEMKAGTLVAEPNAPGTVIWDNFEFGTSGP